LHNRIDTGFIYSGQAPNRTLTFGVHLGPPVKLLGQIIREGEITFLPEKARFEIMSTEPIELFSATVDLDLVVALAPAHLCIDSILKSSCGLMRQSSEIHTTIMKEITSTLTTCLESSNLLKRKCYSAMLERRFAALAVSALDAKVQPLKVSNRLNIAREAISFMSEMEHEPISIRAVCEMIGRSQRTLEMGFADLVGITPKRFLTLIRLHRARRLLLSGKVNRVTAAAIENEFYHFGRFAELYRNIFGETPVATLRKQTLR
jgi:AraC-like DNA-binding protein